MPNLSRWFIFSLFFLPHLAESVQQEKSQSVIRGVALGHYTDIDPQELETKLKEVQSLGANYVSLVVSWSMDHVKSDQIQPRAGFTTTQKSLEMMVRRAHAYGLKVLLFPILDIQKTRPLEWRGTLKPESWERWWQQYEKFILHYAQIAAKTQTEVLCIGSELVTTEPMRERWKALAGKIRKTFAGQLLYSANWDHYDRVQIWDLVDIVGVTAYYEIATQKEASEADMVIGWKKYHDQLEGWSKKIKRPFVITEIGYPSLDGGAVHPWDYTQGTKPDPEEQKRAFAAFVQTWRNQMGLEAGNLQGVFIWNWYGPGGPKDTQYSPRGKPAAEVIQRWFKEIRQ